MLLQKMKSKLYLGKNIEAVPIKLSYTNIKLLISLIKHKPAVYEFSSESYEDSSTAKGKFWAHIAQKNVHDFWTKLYWLVDLTCLGTVFLLSLWSDNLILVTIVCKNNNKQ